MDIVITAIFGLIILTTYIYYLSVKKFNYWIKRDVPHLKPAPILGNFKEYILQKKYLGHVINELCKTFKDKPCFGAFYGTEPTLIVKDPELVKVVLTKDFYYFNGREASAYSHKELIMQNIFFEYGDKWRVMRQNLTPLFTTAKMKKMFYLIKNCSNVFEDLLDKEIAISETMEVRSLMARFTIDCIGSCAFGVNTDVMKDNQNNAFRQMGDVIFDATKYRGFKNIARAIWPAIFYTLGFKAFPTAIDDFFKNMMNSVFKSRQYKPTSRNDFVDLILTLKENNHITGDSMESLKAGAGQKISLELSEELLVAQCVVFFAAGFETSATTLSYTLYELAKNPKYQAHLQNEIDSYLKKHENQIDYDCVTELPYLEACIDEALRIYPVLGVITREVMEDHTLPNGVQLDKGLRVHIPIYYLHHNADFFPEPEKFKPERFLRSEKNNIRPYSYLPFGEGPRICIGMRFAKMQMIAGLVTLLKKFHVQLAPDMPESLQFEPKSIVTQPIGGIHVKLIPREGWESRIYAG